MTRFYDPTAGVVTLDGRDLRHVRGSDLRRNVTMVPQEGFLFTGTIRDNIVFGRPDATDEQVEDACRALGIDGFIRSLQEGYDTFVSFRGSRLSAGQKRLISIARAFLADPPVLDLDEATSSLNPATEGIVDRRSTSCSAAAPASSSRTASAPPNTPTASSSSTRPRRGGRPPPRARAQGRLRQRPLSPVDIRPRAHPSG